MRATTATTAAALAALALAALALGAAPACRAPRDAGPCTCEPGNTAAARALGEAAPMDGPALVLRLRHHQRLVEEHRNPRDIKVYDDALRYAILDFCRPCTAWVGERLTMEEMFPLDRLAEATSAVCMGLVLRDGSIAYGAARPPACRRAAP